MNLNGPFPMAMGRRNHFKIQGRRIPLTDLNRHCFHQVWVAWWVEHVGRSSRSPRSGISLWGEKTAQEPP